MLAISTADHHAGGGITEPRFRLARDQVHSAVKQTRAERLLDAEMIALILEQAADELCGHVNPVYRATLALIRGRLIRCETRARSLRGRTC